MKRILPFALLASFTTPALFAQGHGIPPDLAPFTVTWPGGTSAVDFTRAVALQFDGDGVPDVVQLRGENAVLFVSPAVFDTATTLKNGGSLWRLVDVDVLRGLGTNGNDALIVLDPAGLHIVRYDAVGTFDLAFTKEDIVSQRWVGAERVRSADLNADGWPDLIGVAGDGLTVLQLLNDGQGHFIEVQDLTFTDAIVDLDAIQWDLDAPLEIAVLNVRGVLVVEQNGTIREARPKIYSAGDSIAVIGQTFGPLPPPPAMQRQRVAWARLALDGSHHELLAFGTANALEGPYSLGSIGLRALAEGDYDRDGDSDLLLSDQQGGELLRITNQRSEANPAIASFATLETYARSIVEPSVSVASFATPLFVDLDNDSKSDVFTARATTSPGFAYALLLPAAPLNAPAGDGTTHLMEAAHPAFVRADFVSASVVAYVRSETAHPELDGCLANPQEGLLFLEILLSGWGQDASSANEIEITGWAQPDWDDDVPPNNNAYEHRYYSLSDVGCPSGEQPYPCAGEDNIRVAIRVPELTPSFLHCYFLQVRLRKVDASGVTNYRTYIAGFTGDFADTGIPAGACDYLIDQQGAWPASIPYGKHDDVPCDTVQKAHNLGGLVPQSRMPHFAPGFTPQVPPIQFGPPPPGIHGPPYP